MCNYILEKLTQEEISDYISKGISLAPCVLYGVHDKSFAWICKEEMCDMDYIQQHNISYKKIDGAGSTIICSEGDLDFGFFGSEDFCKKMFNRISNLVSKKLTNGELLNNDFMYNNNKYGSVTKINFGDIYYVGVHISNNINKELINKICQKKCFKQPEKMPIPITEQDVFDLYGDINCENDI